MVAFTSLLLAYLLGGLTFIPIVLAAVYLHWYYGAQVSAAESADTSARTASEARDAPNSPVELPEELKQYVKGRRHEADVAAGYFAVCREYVPGGVNGKPPERTTPAGAVVANESPSVYQSMYRGIFGRDKNAAPTIQNEPGKGNVKVKKGRNVFYVVLRLGHLMLYDDVEQLEVRHVISLAHHGVDIYGGGETIPEGELFVKRNCIRLTSRRIAGELSSESRPFYLFSDNCSEKEDFYHALLQNQEQRDGSPDNPPKPLQFEQAHLIKLVQQLHASEENLQTRWINALLGRLFLGMYKTADVENIIRAKITKKISRVQKPNFISSITVGKMSMGDAAPIFTNPKLRELTMAGDVTVEADVMYNGGFRIEVMAVARIDLGKRMGGVRELNLLLAAVAKKVEGHLLFRVKPPPSNRVWFSFESAPKMDISIEPVVAQRQIKYGFILRAIESRVREVLAETLVHPNWDDVPFSPTFLQRFRGGIWEDDVKADASLPAETLNDSGEDIPDDFEKQAADGDTDMPRTSQLLSDREKTKSTPFLANTAPIGLTKRNRGASRTATDLSAFEAAASSSIDSNRSNQTSANGVAMPKVLRSHSFTSKAAEPTLHSEPIIIDPKSRTASVGAASPKGLDALQSLSRSSSPAQSPVGSPERRAETAEIMRQATRSNKGSVGSIRSNLSATSDANTTALREDLVTPVSERKLSSPSTRTSLDAYPARSLPHSRDGSTDLCGASDGSSSADKEAEPLSKAAKRAATFKALSDNAAEKRQSLNAAASAAKRWGLGVIAARQNARNSGTASISSQNSESAASEDHEDEGHPAASLEHLTSMSTAGSESTDAGPSTPNSARASRVLELEKGTDRAPSPSMIPRRIGSTNSQSSASSTSTNRPYRQSSPQPSKIPTLSNSASSSSLNKNLISSKASSPSLAPSNFSNPALAPSQQEIEARLRTSHNRSPSIGVVNGPGSPSMPLGRGQPLPPPGKPLPGPRSGTWVGAAGAMLSGMRRKPVSAPEGNRSGSTDEGRLQRKPVGRQELDAKRKQYEQEKHIIGASPVDVESDSGATDSETDDLDGQGGDVTLKSPPPLPKRPTAAVDEDGASEQDSAGAQAKAPPLPKRKSSIPVTKRPVPKPPLPKRENDQGTVATEQQDIAAAARGFSGVDIVQDPRAPNHQTEQSQHERLEHLDDDAILRDEEELADETGPPDNVDRGSEEDDPEALPAELVDGTVNDEDGHAREEADSEDDDETFGPMEMNVPESPVTAKSDHGEAQIGAVK